MSRRIAFLIAVGCVIFSLYIAISHMGYAGTGDLLKTVNLPSAARCTFGVSMALVPGSLVGFPNSPILLVTSCREDGNPVDKLFYLDYSTDPATLVKTVTTNPTANGGWGSLAFRADKSDLTGCGWATPSPIYRIDPNSGVTTFLFNTGLSGCDGHTWDAGDQTFYASADASSTIFHFSATGASLGSFSSAPGCPNSGLAVGGSILFEACDGVLTIFRVNKVNGAVIGSFPSAGQRTEDLECDPISFSAQSVDAMWSKDAFTNQVFAFEIPKGECGPGGNPVGIPEISAFSLALLLVLFSLLLIREFRQRARVQFRAG